MNRITHIRRLALAAAILLAVSTGARAQRFTVGTNAVDLLSLGTLNAEASVAVAQHYSVHGGAELNPWTWNRQDPEKQLQQRQNSYWGGVRWWPWHVYSGWWAGMDGRYTIYNGGGITGRETEEGDALGGGLYGGYALMLSDNWNLDLGVGLWGGWKKYTTYACPVCGVITGEGQKGFVLPDARIALQWIF